MMYSGDEFYGDDMTSPQCSRPQPRTKYEYLCFGLNGEYFGTVYTLKEAKAHKDRVPGVYYYRRQIRMAEGQTIG